MHLLKTKKGCYIYRISHSVLHPTLRRLYITNFSPYSAFHPDDSSPAFTLNANLILLFERDYYHQCLHKKFDQFYYLTHFLTQVIAPIISISSAMLIQSFSFDLEIVSLGNCSGWGKGRQKYFSANWLSLKKSGQTHQSVAQPHKQEMYTLINYYVKKLQGNGIHILQFSQALSCKVRTVHF